MIRSLPTISSYPSHTSAITSLQTDHISFREPPIPLDYGIAALSIGRGGSIYPVLRCSNPTAVEVSSTAVELDSAASIVRKFYDGVNRRDLASVEDLFALDCVYEDLVFSQPFTGRKAILDFFKKFSDSISGDLQFAIDDISEEDTSAVGVTWHLEWKGKPFPFSRGCSFYRLKVINGQRQIVYGRDAVEPAVKPGESALVIIRGVTWLLQTFPFLGDRL